MAKIVQLKSEIYNKISAGEVVENPASCVKELVENSIDAGASRIFVSIVEGGLKKITVSDNGCGISSTDLKNAFMPHATSKITVEEDLYNISTLGFRGEALPSIASVAKVRMRSRALDSDVAYELSIHDGAFSEIVETALDQGTIIEIEDLFFNTPARLKFMKKPKTEEGYVTTVVERLILAYPEIEFTYVCDDKTIYNTSGSGLDEAFYVIFGKSAHESKIELKHKGESSVAVSGYVCNPSFTKSNRNYQTVIVNSRCVNDSGISAVVQNAFGERIMKRNFPVFAITITLPFDEVDVNVHPAKSEVRFKNSRAVYGAVYDAVKTALISYEAGVSSVLSSAFTNEPCKTKVEQTVITEPENTIKQVKEAKNTGFNSPKRSNLDLKSYLSTFSSSTSTKSSMLSFSEEESGLLSSVLKNVAPTSNDESKPYKEIITEKHEKEKAVEINTASKTVEAKKTSLEYKILGQFSDCYLIISTDEALYLIDQHAAHERYIYDNLMAQIERGDIYSQNLLVPYVHELCSADFVKITGLFEELRGLGFEIDEFGASCIKISALPSPLVSLNIPKFIEGLLASDIFEKKITIGSILREKIIQTSCKTAIKAGDRLNDEQIKVVIKNVLSLRDGYTCPHGRPIYVKFSVKDLEKLFKRIV